MNRTYTPELKPDVLNRLAEYAAGFRDDFNRTRQAAWCGVYLRGLIHDGDRKSVEPMAARVPLPEGLDVADPDQALQQFLGQSTWDEQAVLIRYRATMAAKFADPVIEASVDRPLVALATITPAVKMPLVTWNVSACAVWLPSAIRNSPPITGASNPSRLNSR